VPTVSRNGSPEAIAAVRSGRTTATLDYHLPEIGRLAGRTALAALAGALAPDTLVAAPFGELFTASNADAYVPWRERVPHDPLVVVSARPSGP
jgi:ABC-type sugar transport system substrate-binding protein